MATWKLPSELTGWIEPLTRVLDARNAWRLLPLMGGMLLAGGRQTVSSWLRSGELGDDYRAYYYFLGSLGRKVKVLAFLLLRQALDVLAPGPRLLFALDDTPTQRYGPLVEGAGIHHHPTPGPAGHKYLSGHVWVTLSWLVRHTLWGTIGLPLLACLYVRQKNLPKLAARYGLSFQTKLQQAAGLVEWLAEAVQDLNKELWVVTEGAYAKKPFLDRARKAGVRVVSRLRKDAALWSVPKPVAAGRRGPGRPRKYGRQRIRLAQRAGHRGGWQEGLFHLYGREQPRRYKTFLATYKPAGGRIRVVLVKEDDGSWRAYFCTDPNATVAAILAAVADRSAIEQNFHDLKEVHGTGQQQVRNYWANMAAYHLTLWWHTLIELWAWHQPASALRDRRNSPWDDAGRRPSHGDRRKALRRQTLQEEFRQHAVAAGVSEKIRRLWNRMLGLAT
jgi:hypothetical protein